MPQRILVTGGFGFIGSHLVERLLRTTEDTIHVVDDLSTSPLPLERLLEELQPPARRLTYDLCTVEVYCAEHFDVPVDQLYHLASIVGPAGVIPHMGKMVRAIVRDTTTLMDIALRHRARLLDVSTSEVYGGGQQGLCAEDMPKIVPPRSSARLEYAVAKLAAETALMNTCQVTELHASIIRPFNVAGPRQSGRGGFVLPRFVWRALEGLPLQVFGDGSQVRAFTHVQDIVSGLLLAMARSRPGAVYNLGHPGNKCSILDLAKAVIRVAGSSSEILFVDPKSVYGPLYEEANNKFPVSEKAFAELQWQPVYSRDETIEEVVKYFTGLPDELRRLLGGAEEIDVSRRAHSSL